MNPLAIAAGIIAIVIALLIAANAPDVTAGQPVQLMYTGVFILGGIILAAAFKGA